MVPAVVPAVVPAMVPAVALSHLFTLLAPARPLPTPPGPSRPRQVHLAERTERHVAEEQLGSLLCAVQTHFARVRDRLKGKRTLLLTLLPLLLLSVLADPDLGPGPGPEFHSGPLRPPGPAPLALPPRPWPPGLALVAAQA